MAHCFGKSYDKAESKELEAGIDGDPVNQDSGSDSDSGDENKSRGNWSGKLDFLLSCLSYAVGLGNLWRFPYLCYSNGGGAFLIPYTIMLVFIGLPLFFLEMSFGQFASLGVVSAWKLSPLFTGVGYAMFIVSCYIATYYNTVIALALYYTFASFTSNLPWAGCDNDWNTEACNLLHMAAEKNCSRINGTYFNGTCYDPLSIEFMDVQNISNNFTEGAVKLRMPSDEYFHNFVLELTDGLHDLGGLKWQLSLCLLLAWFFVGLCVIKGIKSSGKAVYFTAFFPYVVLTILLVRGATLKGALEGIKFYVTPQWERLASAKVWGDAAVQIFFSLSPGWGGLITLASYNRFHNNCLRDSIVVSFGNCFTSVYAGFVIFSVIGYMADQLQLPIDKVASEGAGLAFIVYPQVVTSLPPSPLWAILFFAMLITLGLGTQMSVVITVHTTLLDLFSSTLRRGKRPILLMIALCLAGFTLGLFCCSRGGMFVLQLFDSYSATYSTLLIGLTESLVIAWVYGYKRFFRDIELMLGRYPHWWWRAMWCFVSPGIIVFIIFFTWIDFKSPVYGDYVFPTWANAIGWIMSLSSVSAIPIVAVIKICREKQDLPLWQRIKALAAPAEDWGPALAKHRREREIQIKAAAAAGDESPELIQAGGSPDYINSTTTFSSTVPLRHGESKM